MALGDVFLTPLGLLAVLVAVPIVLLYLIRPDPEELELPTYRFLADEEKQQSSTPLMEQLSRSWLLLLQILVVLLLAVGLATPFVPVSERAAVDETVLVVDTSASMATTDGGESRLEAAVAAAEGEVTGTTTIVTTARGGEILNQRVGPETARPALSSLEPTDAPGDLRGAISQAAAVADEDARIVVLSDFDGDDWEDAVALARGQGISVVLEQFGDGGEENVGFVDREFQSGTVRLWVRNFGGEAVTRTVTLGDRQRRVTLEPGEVGSVRLPVPAGGGTARLGTDDGFETDNRVHIAAPEDPAVDVLVLTNDENRYLTTALEVIDEVELTVENPPTTVEGDYDVVIYSNVEPNSLLPGNVEAGREVVADGGGVAVQAQENLPEGYGNLLLVEETGEELREDPSVETTRRDELTEGFDFGPPEAHVVGGLREGTPLVTLDDGSPLLATAERGPGRLLYYGYIEERSNFRFDARYPVFWRRAVFFLADRQTLESINHETGETVSFADVAVEGPDGPREGPEVYLDRAGVYETAEGQASASLLDETESNVTVGGIENRTGPAGEFAGTEARTVPRTLVEFLAVGALCLVVGEVAYLRRRGDL